MNSASTFSLHQRTAWIFDLDGTLTEPVHDFAHIRQELGILPEQDILTALDARPEPERSESHARLMELELHYAQQTRPAAGVLPLLEGLQAKGCRLGILTRNSRGIALAALEAIGAGGFFLPEQVLGRDEARPKPDPEGIEKLLSLWQCPPEQAVMVGDFRYDLETGRAAGTYTVHVDARARHWPEITDLRVESLCQLQHHLACN